MHDDEKGTAMSTATAPSPSSTKATADRVADGLRPGPARRGHVSGGTPPMTYPAPPSGTARLLSAWQARQSARLADHLAHHGPPAMPPRHARGWAGVVARMVADAGLTGRGGGGFPTGAKLASITRAGGRPWLVVNAMEGEPESAKDRVLLHCAPHLVLDGAELVAAALGADRITVCVADDQDATASAVSSAVAEREGTELAPVAVELARPPARFVGGEESALTDWLRRGVGLPTFRPDKSVPLTAGRRTVLVHNAETLAQVALIARHGAAWFRQLGTPESPGTMLVTVSGAVGRPGVVEVEVGTSIESIITAAVPTAEIAAVLVGGRGGTWIGPDALRTPLAPGPLREIGAAVGAGIVVVLPVGMCGVAEVARIATAMAGESAGQCGPCVYGLPAVADDLRRLAGAAGYRTADPELGPRLQRRLQAVIGRGACKHPDGVARMVRSGLQVFADDAARHAAGLPCLSAGPADGGHRGTRRAR